MVRGNPQSSLRGRFFSALRVELSLFAQIVNPTALEEDLSLATRQVVGERERPALREVARGHRDPLAQSIPQTGNADAVALVDFIVRLRIPEHERRESEVHKIVPV